MVVVRRYFFQRIGNVFKKLVLGLLKDYFNETETVSVISGGFYFNIFIIKRFVCLITCMMPIYCDAKKPPIIAKIGFKLF